MRLLFFFIIINLSAVAKAQSKFSYTAATEVQFLKGGSDKSGAFFFTNGVRYKNEMIGIGAGIDNYLMQSIPLFADVRQSLGHCRLQPFLDAAAGINFPFLTKDQKQTYAWNADRKNGVFLKTSAGLSLQIQNRVRIFLSGGYSYKTTTVDWGPVYIPYTNLTAGDNRETYRLNRWCVTTGFWF